MISSSSNKKLHGFTLIELLIVIAVIGILATSVLTLINPLQQFAKARDSERKKTLRELANALERYMIKRGSYPIGGWFSSEPGDNAPNGPSINGDWIPGLLASNEITRLPRDPKGGAGNSLLNPILCGGGGLSRSAYWYRSNDGTCYKLLAHCSPEETPLYPNDPFADPSRPAYAWMVCEPRGSSCCSL